MRDAAAPTALPPVVVFAYDFPHRKTQDVLLRLFLDGVRVDAVLAAPRVALSIPAPSVRTKVRGAQALHPRDVAARLGADYVVLAHDGPEIGRVLAERAPSLGVIGGARILPREVIEAFAVGVLNLHPGLIPEVRGLDALLWAVRGDHPLGVTAHLVDERVDAGAVLATETIRVAQDDTPFDLSEKLYHAQLGLLRPALERAVSGERLDVTYEGHPYNRKMPAELEAETLAALPGYLRRHASS